MKMDHILTLSEDKLKHFLERHFVVKTVLISTLVSMFMQVPSFPEVYALYPTRAILEISEDPWEQMEYDIGSHAEKKTLRLFVPLMVQALHLEYRWQVYLLFCVFNFILLAFISILLREHTNDRVFAFVITVGMSCTYFGFSGFGDTKGWADIVPFVLVMVSMLRRNALLLSVTLFLAMTADERAFVSGFFVLWWWMNLHPEERGLSLLNQLGRNLGLVFGFFAAVGGFILFRVFLHIGLGFEMPTGNVGWETFLEQNVEHMLPAIWGSFESYWLILISYLLILFLNKKMMSSFGVLLVVVSYIFCCFMIHDVTRSVSYLFPLLMLAMVVERQSQHAEGVISRSYMLLSVLNILAPTQYVYGKMRSYAPSFFRGIQFLR